MRTDRLVVYDDLFPDLRSGFRLAELSAYLDHFPGSVVAVSNLAGRPRFDAALRNYQELRPEHVGRTIFFSGDLPLASRDFLYSLFLNNAYDLLALSESHGVPFAFQLYPGGGFRFDNPESDERLRCVIESPMFSFMIVTQPAVRDYVASRFAVPADRLHLIGPGPVWTSADTGAPPRPHFGRGKPSFDVGFIAHKYDHNIRSKGYDFFVEVARSLRATEEHARFHVVGNYAPEDHPLDGLVDCITFHGSLDAVALDRVCRSLDVVVSPNVPSALYPGNFDGFPTASCSQAALAGAIVFATDPLGLNSALTTDRDFLLLERDPTAVLPGDVERAANTLRRLAANPDRLVELSVQGRRAFDALVGPQAQIAPRLALLRTAMSGGFAPSPSGPASWRAAAVAAHQRSLRERAEIARLHGVIEGAKDYLLLKDQRIAELQLELHAVEQARDWHRKQSEAWERECQRLLGRA